MGVRWTVCHRHCSKYSEGSGCGRGWWVWNKQYVTNTAVNTVRVVGVDEGGGCEMNSTSLTLRYALWRRWVWVKVVGVGIVEECGSEGSKEYYLREQTPWCGRCRRWTKSPRVSGWGCVEGGKRVVGCQRCVICTAFRRTFKYYEGFWVGEHYFVSPGECFWRCPIFCG